MDQQTVNGAPGSILLGGRVYLVAAPEQKDLGTLGAFLNKRAKSPVQALRDDPDFALLPEAERLAKLEEAARKKFDQALPYDSRSILDVLTSAPGVRFLAWLLIKKAEPAVQYEELAALITEENCDIVYLKLAAASGMDALGN